MSITYHNIEKLNEIRSLIENLSSDFYLKPLSILDNATIGMHIRHILEFIICIQNGINSKLICFDDRERNMLLETDRLFAINKIEEIKLFLSGIDSDMPLEMKANYSVNKDEVNLINTSLFRELAYVLDHTVHHLAIVKIALTQEGEGLILDKNFGVAPSTIRFRKEVQNHTNVG